MLRFQPCLSVDAGLASSSHRLGVCGYVDRETLSALTQSNNLFLPVVQPSSGDKMTRHRYCEAYVPVRRMDVC